MQNNINMYRKKIHGDKWKYVLIKELRETKKIIKRKEGKKEK